MAHEIGHNLGMSHDFDEVHGGPTGECNGKGIMSYGSMDRNQWSTCSRSDFERHYKGLDWGNGCFEDISGKTYVKNLVLSSLNVITSLYLMTKVCFLRM